MFLDIFGHGQGIIELYAQLISIIPMFINLFLVRPLNLPLTRTLSILRDIQKTATVELTGIFLFPPYRQYLRNIVCYYQQHSIELLE